MKTLYIAATKIEVQPTLQALESDRVGHELYRFNSGPFLAITGVGMTETTLQLQHILYGIKPDVVVNIGVAGVYGQRFPLGSLVEVVTDQYGDLGVDDLGQFVPAKALDLIDQDEITVLPSFPQLEKVTSITVNQVAGSELVIQQRIDQFNPVLESMEGFAVFRVCQHFGIPCAQVRSISNHVEPRNRANWKLDLAIDTLNNFLIKEIKARL